MRYKFHGISKHGGLWINFWSLKNFAILFACIIASNYAIGVSMKRGPKPSSNRDTVLFKRVPKEDRDALAALVDAAMLRSAEKWFDDNRKYLADGKWFFKNADSVFPANAGAVLDNPPPKEHHAAQYLTEISTLKADNTALLESVDKLTKDKEYWEQRFEKAVNATEGQMVAYWRNRALKAEQAAGAGKSEFDQS